MVVVYDIETLASLFTYTYLDINNNTTDTFVIHKDLNEIHKLYDHLDICEKQIGFNNINFDYPIIHNILLNRNRYLKLTAEEVINNIYQAAQDIINNQSIGDFAKSSTIPHKEILIEQVDLFRIWHYNNKARSTSLKSLQISMNYPNVMEMPISHTDKNITLEQVDDIVA